MPRVSKTKVVNPKQLSGPLEGGGGRIKELSAFIQGRPGTTVVQQTFPIIRKPSYFKGSIRMLIKRDVSKGLSMPEADKWAIRSGVLTSDTGGFKGGVKVVLQHPPIPVRAGKNTRVIPAPSPTNSAGVRSPYNVNQRVGKRGNNARFNKG